MCEIQTHPNEPDHTQAESRVQDDCEVKVLFAPQRFLVLSRITCVFHPVDVLNRNGQTRIGQHPDRDQPCSECLVLIIHGGFLNDFLDDELRDRALDCLLELVIEVALVPRCILNNGLV